MFGGAAVNNLVNAAQGKDISKEDDDDDDWGDESVTVKSEPKPVTVKIEPKPVEVAPPSTKELFKALDKISPEIRT